MYMVMCNPSMQVDGSTVLVSCFRTNFRRHYAFWNRSLLRYPEFHRFRLLFIWRTRIGRFKELRTWCELRYAVITSLSRGDCIILCTRFPPKLPYFSTGLVAYNPLPPGPIPFSALLSTFGRGWFINNGGGYMCILFVKFPLNYPLHKIKK